MLYSVPFGHGRRFGADAGTLTQALLGGWEVGGIVNARSGLPVPVQIVRPDIVYQDATGNIFANPAAGRTAIINVPGGGASRNVRRPDLIPGVDPFIKDGGLLFLNPAAFATPAPGTFGNLERNAIHGPGSKQVDMFFAKHFNAGARRDIEFRAEVFNLFDTVNFANPIGTLPQAIPTAALTEANRLQPGQPYTAAAAGTFGRLSSTVGPDRRPRHAAPDPVRGPLLVLTGLLGACSARGLLRATPGACSEHAEQLADLRTRGPSEGRPSACTLAPSALEHMRARSSLLLALGLTAALGGVPRQHRRHASAAPAASRFVFFWAGDADRSASDFLAVVDADPRSAGYASVVATLPVGRGRDAPAPHRYAMPAGGLLWANGFDASRPSSSISASRPPVAGVDLRRSGAVRPSAQLRAPAERPRAGHVPVGDGRRPPRDRRPRRARRSMAGWSARRAPPCPPSIRACGPTASPCCRRSIASSRPRATCTSSRAAPRSRCGACPI